MFKPNRREAQKKMQETEINQNPITRVGTRDLHSNFSSTFVIRENKEAGRKCSHGGGSTQCWCWHLQDSDAGEKSRTKPMGTQQGTTVLCRKLLHKTGKNQGRGIPHVKLQGAEGRGQST